MENNFVVNEHKTLKFWEGMGLLGKIKEKNKNGQPWSFLDGPITANNPMGAHHAWGRTLKDLFQRFKAMQGYKQRLQNGFDCQGLWVEVEVEKELGFKSKKDIETYGIEKFVNKCKERAHKYSKIQTQQSIRLGMLRDWGNWQTEFDEKGEWIKQSHSYYTLSDENNYAIWHFLKICHEKSFLYKGHDVVAWCPRCGTAISQHEILTEEYKEITHQAIYFKLPVVGEDKTYFLAWTTTPWTLPGNVFLSAHPDLIYAKVKANNGDIYILLKDKADLIEGGEIIETFEGKALENKTYTGLFGDLPSVARCERSLTECNRVVLWKEVTAEEGTGIVHSAPGCGAEDFQLAKENKMPVIDLTDNESNYREGFGELSGKFVGTEQVRQYIFSNLESRGLVYKIEDYQHRYPTCWRCKSELIFRLVDEWYISMDKLREPLMKAVEKINWLPGFCKEREADWLKNMRDWLISKKRYWGLALPIFECECGSFEVIGSLEELQKRAIEGWQDFEGHSPHRPWLDAVKIKCAKCEKIISRIMDVGTPWLDAGIVPFSTISNDNRSANIPYFHNNKKEWQKWFPAELVCEGFPGQFKNWFYVLLVMSQVLENEPPFKNLLGFANVVDEKGEEMHKSKGNAIWFDEAVEKIGADVMRWMYALANPANNLRFGYGVAKEVERKILTLTNCFTFYQTYVSNPVILSQQAKNPEQETPRFAQGDGGNVLDKWILSRLNNIIKEVTESLEKFDSVKASQAIEDFWINDLSLWYVRRSRKRFEEAEPTFHDVLITIAKLIAPFMPFLAERMYQELAPRGLTPGDCRSVHLCDWPLANKKAIDEKLEQDMQVVRDIVSLALAKRMDLKIGVRQALQKLKVKPARIAMQSIAGGSAKLKVKEELLDLIKDEVNVKEVVFDEGLDSEVELDTAMTDELKEEGLVREIIRHIQDLRKKAGLTPQGKVDIYFATQESLAEVIAKNQKQILAITKSQAIQENSSKQPARNASLSDAVGPARNASRSDAGGGEFLAQKEVKINEETIWLGIK
ncbi:isoleucine--tRNA ligase [bacterium (Candidatus Gribaldobacteria) CG10_big_fil_rev_8_21_14_0_10_41_12]|uniref:Isoleucine--tRNA ligase n=1 Tax=bacterium (Candidatus Gribaldobacteria) CG10_big_fil_rev_8_21_14_0_10_41_12 TaxID=2014277 RepID=A0A2H0UY60_9BACT|nr:MAG: isoleucine--tRNA ligase [bacterium (Candidatus Gribaldobacteria) CG10_big_fil_rev_8_21_14_0_10_41_12]